MSVKISGRYVGNKKCELLHGPSGTKLHTAAPVDIGGDGSSFSPTDLVPTALGSCMLTTMAMVAERNNIHFENVSFEAEKHMSTAPPRLIARIPITIRMPATLTAEERKKLEHAAHACPVHRSLGAETKVELEFLYL